MKLRLLLLGFVSWLSSVTGLAQFSLTAALRWDVDDSSYVLDLTASGPQDLYVVGARFDMEIVIWDWQGGTVPPAPTFSPSASIVDTPFETDPMITVVVVTPYGSDDISGQSVDIFSSTIPPSTFFLPFSQEGPQRMLSVGIDIPDDLASGKWLLRLPNHAFNHLSVPTSGGTTYDIPFNEGHYLSYILNYDDDEDTLTLDVPEPSQFALIGGLALLGFAVWRRSRK